MRSVLLMVVALATAAQGALEWQQQEIRLQVHPAQVNAEAIFEFQNTGSEPVSIRDVIITCGCLSRKPYREQYAPGEKGSLTIVFNLRGRQGPQRKHVLVATSDGKQTELILLVNIPRLYVAEPTLLTWKAEDPETTKTFRLTNPNAEPIRLVSISSSHERLPARLRTLREGFEYEVEVTRKPETENARSVIRITAEPPPGLEESRMVRIYVYAM